MKKRLYLYILTAIVVMAVAAGVMQANAHSDDPTEIIPQTGDPLVVPPYNGELDVAQQDEVAKLAEAPIVVPPYNGELDVAQQDEVAKLGSFTQSEPPEDDSTTRRIDLGAGYWLVLGPDSGKIVREGSTPMASVGLPEIPITGALEQPPASLSDYTLTQRQRYQITEPVEESLTAPLTGELDTEQQQVAAATHRTYLGAGYWLLTGPNGGEIIPPPAREQAWETQVEASSGTDLMYLGAGYWMLTGPDGAKIIPPFKSAVEMNQPQASTSSTQRIDLGGGYWLEIGPDGYNFIH